MKMNRSLLYAGIAVVIVSLVGNYAFFVSSQLQKPIMLKHYYYVPSSQGYIIHLHYIANRSDELDIQWVTIPGMEGEFFSKGPQHGQKYRHYELKTFSLEVNERFLTNIDENSFSFNQVKAHLSNGDILTMDIGEITLYKWNDRVLQFQISGSSSDHTGYHILKADQDIKITGLAIPYAEELKSALSLKLNSNQVEVQQHLNQKVPGVFQDDGRSLSKDLFPIMMKKDELLSINYQFSFQQNDSGRFNYYKIRAALEGQEMNGQTFSEYFPFSYQPYLAEKEIREIVKGENND
ncbi:hypothetical protein [Bacillus sp. JJ1474]|uniref:hypothetical protein n=1 Tax=Bacillus sp. JJ1474 TaxID=3122955 RepID=UPI003000C1D5